MASDDLIAKLRADDDPLHVQAADALSAQRLEIERLRDRAALLEAVATLNAETIRNMQRAGVEGERTLHRRPRRA